MTMSELPTILQTMKLKIKVARRHIQAANHQRFVSKRGIKATSCPIAFALLEEGFDDPQVQPDRDDELEGTLEVGMAENDPLWGCQGLTRTLSREANRRANRWDKTGRMDPFTFEIRI